MTREECIKEALYKGAWVVDAIIKFERKGPRKCKHCGSVYVDTCVDCVLNERVLEFVASHKEISLGN